MADTDTVKARLSSTQLIQYIQYTLAWNPCAINLSDFQSEIPLVGVAKTAEFEQTA